MLSMMTPHDLRLHLRDIAAHLHALQQYAGMLDADTEATITTAVRAAYDAAAAVSAHLDRAAPRAPVHVGMGMPSIRMGSPSSVSTAGTGSVSRKS